MLNRPTFGGHIISGQPCTFLFDGNYFPCRTDEQCAAMIGLRLVKIPSALFPECSIDGNMYARTYRRLFHEFNSEEADDVHKEKPQ